MQEKASSDILVLQENTQGNDYIIGDLHGNASAFENVLKILTPSDRLFLVGDLTDRGSDSLGVIKHFVNHQKQVYCVMGNHETIVLQTIKLMITLFQSSSLNLFSSPKLKEYLQNDTKDKELLLSIFKEFDDYFVYEETHYKKLYRHILEDRDWVVKLFILELTDGLIHDGNKKGNIVFEPKSEISTIIKLFSHLPYIIHVEGSNPFHVVHADMPFEDNELNQRIENKTGLSLQEKKYALWARRPMKNIKIDQIIRTENRHSDSVTTYVGHNIISNSHNEMIRKESHTINLDIATFKTNNCLMVNHSAKKSKFVGPKEKISMTLTFKRYQLEEYLNNLLVLNENPKKRELINNDSSNCKRIKPKTCNKNNAPPESNTIQFWSSAPKESQVQPSSSLNPPKN